MELSIHQYILYYIHSIIAEANNITYRCTASITVSIHDTEIVTGYILTYSYKMLTKYARIQWHTTSNIKVTCYTYCYCGCHLRIRRSAVMELHSFLFSAILTHFV